ncbi:MAG: DUF222 domain-containing protein [bacterium]|nr:DUF222 domain-containing protein [bacterium]
MSYIAGKFIHMNQTTTTDDTGQTDHSELYEAISFYGEDPIRAAEERIKEDQKAIDRLRGRQVSWLKLVIRRKGTYRDGYRSLIDWTASRLDIPHKDAADLAYLARRLDDETISMITEGYFSFSRTLSKQRLLDAGGDQAAVAESEKMDLLGVKKLAARYRKMSKTDDKKIFESQYVNLRESDDGRQWYLSGRLTAIDGEIIRKALDKRADTVPDIATGPDRQLTPAQKQAIGLTTMAADDLDGHINEPHRSGDCDGREPVVTVIKQADLAEASDNTQGIEIGRIRIGPDALAEIECVGREETVYQHDEQKVEPGPTTRQIPRKLRRAVLARDGKCVIDSCGRIYRLQTHHIIPQKNGGPHTSENLATLCFFHHHIAIHRLGHQIDPHSPPHRRRLLPPEDWTGYRHPTNRIYRNQDQQQEHARQVYLKKYKNKKTTTQTDTENLPHPGG